MTNGYSNLHRFTMRMFFQRPATTLSEFLETFNDYCVQNEEDEDIYGSYLSEQGLDRLAFEVNEELVKFNCHLRIKKEVMKEQSNKVYWVLVNTVDDGLSTLATKLKPWETILFKKLVEEVVDMQKQNSDQNCFLPTAKIMSIANKVKASINHNELLEYLNKLVGERWLYENTRVKGRYCLGIRAKVELESLIAEMGE